MARRFNTNMKQNVNIKAKLNILIPIGIAILLCFSSSNGAFAQNSSKNAEDKTPSLEVGYVSPYLIAASPLSIEIVTNAPLGSTVQVSVFNKTNIRSQLTSFAKDLGSTKIKDTTELTLDVANSTERPSTYRISIPINNDTGLNFNEAGIYPISISIETPNNQKSKQQYTFATYVPNVSSTGATYSQKLNIVPLLSFNPFINRNELIKNNKSSKKLLAENVNKYIDAKKSIDNAISTNSFTSLLLSPETIENASLLGTLSSNDSLAELFPINPGPNVEYIQDTYIPLNIAELEKIDRKDIFTSFLASGRSTLNELGYKFPSKTLVTQAITDNSIGSLSKSGINNIIVEDNTFSTGSRPTQRPIKLNEDDFSISIAASENEIVDALPNSLSDAAKANYLIAASSVIALEAPSTSRGAIIPLDLDSVSSTTIRYFFQDMKNNPLLTTITTDQYFEEINEDINLTRKISNTKYPTGNVSKLNENQVKEISKYAKALESIYAPASIINSNARWSRMVAFSRSDRKVMKALSGTSLRKQVEELNKMIALPEKRTLTLTSREEEIPVTIRNTTGEELKVVIELVSNRLSFPQGSRFTVKLDQENTTLEIPIKVRTAGSFPITIKLLSPAEEVEINKQSATVKSTVISGVGISISVASVLFLLLWWLSHTRRKKKKSIAPIIDLKTEMRI